jgi:hypothetical protein
MPFVFHVGNQRVSDGALLGDKNTQNSLFVERARA